MIEQIIEKVVIDKLAAALAAANVDGVQLLGAWQPTDAATEDPKGVEQKFVRGILSVKALPRRFDTYTMAEGVIPVSVELNVRVEADAHGVDYLTISEALTNVICKWHRDYAEGAADFSMAGEFDFSGFVQNGGDCGLDRERRLWTWIQGFDIQGVFVV